MLPSTVTCLHLLHFQCHSDIKLDYFGRCSTIAPHRPGTTASILPGSCTHALLPASQPASHVMPHCMTTKACSIWLKALINRERIKKWERRKSHSCLSAVHDKQRSWSAACAQQYNYQQPQLILLDKCRGISCMSGQGRRKCLTCVHEIILQT